MLVSSARSVWPACFLVLAAGCAGVAHPELRVEAPRVEPSASAFSVASAPRAQAPLLPPAPELELSLPELAALTGASVVVVNTGQGFGSGFAVGKDLVVTNLHVVGGQSTIVIATPDGAKREVRGIAAVSAAWDLAVLYVPELGLVPLPLGDSERIRVGEQVLAVGNPEGLSLTVSNGIISKKHGKSMTNVLQTTAPISPGSSGGPLVDSHGAVVGVVTLFYNQGQALNFAVASSRLRDLLDSLDGRYVGLEQFAASTHNPPAADVSLTSPTPRPIEAQTFPAAVAGFAFGLDVAGLRRVCPDLVVDTPTLAGCPYLGVELDFASGPARFALANGRMVGIWLQPSRSEAVLQALNGKYGEPTPLAYREEEWSMAPGWQPGSQGGLQWNTQQGFVRYGSDDGASEFLVFVSHTRRAIQQSNY
jgi:S1-C subfamily serine protease